jgi:hypothetical protein
LTRRRLHKLVHGVQAKSCTPATWRTGEREGNPSHSKQKLRRRRSVQVSCVQLYFTDLGAVSRPLSIDGFAVNTVPGALDTAERAGLIDGMPFILMDDGSYDLDLNRFLRACPTMGARSPNTWRSYARDIFVWARFLSERRDGKSVWQADGLDVLAFHRARRLSDAPYRISASSWNRSVAALDKLYRWAVEEEIIMTSPFGYGVTLRRAGGCAPWWPSRRTGHASAQRVGTISDTLTSAATCSFAMWG